MGCFLDETATPAERFAAFLGAAAEQRPQLAAPAEDLVEPDPDRAAVLAVGSLLAFGCDPEAVPVIQLCSRAHHRSLDKHHDECPDAR